MSADHMDPVEGRWFAEACLTMMARRRESCVRLHAARAGGRSSGQNPAETGMAKVPPVIARRQQVAAPRAGERQKQVNAGRQFTPEITCNAHFPSQINLSAALLEPNDTS